MKERESERLKENENEKWGKSTSRELKKEKKTNSKRYGSKMEQQQKCESFAFIISELHRHYNFYDTHFDFLRQCLPFITHYYTHIKYVYSVLLPALCFRWNLFFFLNVNSVFVCTFL